MNKIVNILHLSDLHFGAEPTPDNKVTETAVKKRRTAFNRLITRLKELKLDSKWKIDVVVVSGDIGWQGKKYDYKEASFWLRSLLEAVRLKEEKLILCAGNHDLDWDLIQKTKNLKYLPVSGAEADKKLSLDADNLRDISLPFEAYNTFCQEFPVRPLFLGNRLSYLAGLREVDGLRFLVVNSAWFSRGRQGLGRLWIGLPHLKEIVNKPQFKSSKITVAVLHHPPEYLHDDELKSSTDRLAVYYDYLGKYADIILSSHHHAQIKTWMRKEENTPYTFFVGSSYTKDSYDNNFAVFRIDLTAKTAIRHVFRYDLEEWRSERRLDKYITLTKILKEQTEEKFDELKKFVDVIREEEETKKKIDEEKEAKNKIFEAVKSNSFPKIKKLLEDTEDKPILLKKLLKAKDNYNWTPLLLAAKLGSKDIVQLLLTYGADISAKKDNDGNTALHEACWHNRQQVVDILIKRGADVNARNNNDWTPLHYGVFHGNKEAVMQLLEVKGINVNAKDKDGWTPLHMAVYFDRRDMMVLLFAEDTDVNVKDKYGKTPMYYAISKGHMESIELLRWHGGTE